MITYCRLRPARAPGPAWSATCRREGTTTVEMPGPGPAEVAAVLEAGLLPVAGAGSSAEAAAWVVGPDEAEALAAAGVPGWRITLADRGDGRRVAEALVRCRAAYLRTGRSRVRAAAALARRTGAVVSVFVDTVGDARVAMEAGAAAVGAYPSCSRRSPATLSICATCCSVSSPAQRSTNSCVAGRSTLAWI